MLAFSVHSESAEDAPVYLELKNFYAGRAVLVAGADGFLGKGCLDMLSDLGADVTACSRGTKAAASPATTRRLIGDLSDPACAVEAVDSQTIVFDCIGSAGSIASIKNPGQNLRTECLPHLNLFDACANSPSKPTVVFLSSRLVYGRPTMLPVNESHPLQVQSFYAAHKINVENYLHVYAHNYDLPFVILRLSNPYGPHFPTHDRDYGVINRFIRNALQGRKISVYGDGAQLRDYIFIEDAVVAMLASAMVEACQGETFNLGGPQPISVRDAVECIVAQSPFPDAVEFVPWPDDALRLETGDYWTDFSKLSARVSLPKQLEFHEGVRRTIASLRDTR